MNFALSSPKKTIVKHRSGRHKRGEEREFAGPYEFTDHLNHQKISVF